MDFSIKAFDTKNTIASAKTGCVAVGVFENRKLSQAAQALDGAGQITAALKSGDITGKPGTTLLLRGVDGVAAERVLLVGLGNADGVTEKAFTGGVQATLKAFATLGAADAIIALPLAELKDRDVNWAIRTVVVAARDSIYRTDAQKSKKDPAPAGVKKLALAVPNSAATKLALAQAIAVANGMQLTKDLANLSANVCTPTYLAETAKSLGKEYKFNVEVLERKQLEALKMGSFLSVTNGSEQPPKFIVMKHMGGKPKDAPVVLVGKGITFDTGGISIKPGPGMDEMKYDMGGAASVLGTFRAIGEMGLKLNVIGIVPACENMPSGRATKPGDIVTSMNGLTIEVLNTDAEGRLILCDALTYAERFNPAAVIDVATLTGACIVALGHHHSGLFTRDDDQHNALAEEIAAAGRATGDTVWRLPIGEQYNDQLKSNFADLANIGTPGGASCTAAAFLENFTRKYPWAHVDIAGTAWKSGAAKGATGRPVPLLTNFLINRV
ncbi:leucyl aminopeptidase [Pseudoduganella albidiflava]|uniref:Probable cytosol aminopeptidase n=1 Tax=Pseudoduganella albidiflava TaxID=321983 RepID=A0A411X273_9BURK|nr:leucyl aminopeptidase [Pseudoduganella albidiflava]QBI02972.1 leucyl aminopeptidase [Pseudoduganella albidiflava]GGY57858.1 putative cytosol aminopeptidase [Pseudoduganella albidiflava]